MILHPPLNRFFARLCLITFSISLPVGWVSAGATIEDPSTIFEIDFETTIPEVIAYSSENTYAPALAEPGEFHLENQSSMRLDSRSFSVQNPAADLGQGEGAPTSFGDDLDGDGSSGGRLETKVGGLRFVRGSGENGAAILPEDGTALLIGHGSSSPHQTYLNPTLRVQNMTGAALTRWAVQAQTWFADDDLTPASLTLSYSTDGETFTPIGTITSGKTAPEDGFDRANPEHWSAEKIMGGQFEAMVEAGGYLYLRFERGTETGSAADFVIDNLKLQGQP